MQFFDRHQSWPVSLVLRFIRRQFVSFAYLTSPRITGHGEKTMTKTNGADRAPVHTVVMPLRVWRKMTPQEYAKQHERFGRHVAVSQEIVDGCQEVWVFLSGSIEFRDVEQQRRRQYSDDFVSGLLDRQQYNA